MTNTSTFLMFLVVFASSNQWPYGVSGFIVTVPQHSHVESMKWYAMGHADCIDVLPEAQPNDIMASVVAVDADGELQMAVTEPPQHHHKEVIRKEDYSLKLKQLWQEHAQGMSILDDDLETTITSDDSTLDVEPDHAELDIEYAHVLRQQMFVELPQEFLHDVAD